MLMAKAIQGDAEGFDTMAKIPTIPFPGGPAFRTPLMTLAMPWFAMRARLGI
jgi:gamma-glutamylputrescine oxidase